jgi:hypothetical protein
MRRGNRNDLAAVEPKRTKPPQPRAKRTVTKTPSLAELRARLRWLEECQRETVALGEAQARRFAEMDHRLDAYHARVQVWVSWAQHQFVSDRCVPSFEQELSKVKFQPGTAALAIITALVLIGFFALCWWFTR